RRVLVLAPPAGRALRRGRRAAARADETLRRLRDHAFGRVPSRAADDDSAPRGRRGARARLGLAGGSGLMSGWRIEPWLRARRLLVIRADNIGDVVMTGPALRAVKRALPTARLELLASPAGATAAPLLPWIDGVLCRRVLWQDLGRLPHDPARERRRVAGRPA